MLIDWFTVIAQTANFLILVWLMKRFLYQPILNALDAREKRIATELADADKKKAEARMEREAFRHKNEEFDRQRASLLNKATDEADAERQRLLDEARKNAEGLRIKMQDMLNDEYQGLHEEFARRTRTEVFAIARKTLADLAGANLEECMIDVFVHRLHELDNEEKKRLISMLKPDTPAIVRSAFELALAQRTLIEKAIKQTLATDTPIRFETAADLISGIEFTLQGQKIAWSIADYLASLEKDVNELLKAKHKLEVHTANPKNNKHGS